MSYGKGEEHSFYCLNCGLRGIPLMRPNSRKREKFHRKKLYCPHCKITVNHIEITNQFDLNEFQEAFANGDFVAEAIESVKECAENEQKKSISNVRTGRFW